MTLTGTPSLRDIIFHTQWCAALSMVAVEWPQFACEWLHRWRSQPEFIVIIIFRSSVIANGVVDAFVQYVP